MSLLILVPFLGALFTCLGASLYSLRRKSLAQSVCIHQAARIQDDLRRPLRKLLKLNPKAEHLRQRREVADRQVEVATGSGYAPAIAIARAHQTEVLIEQTVLHARQLEILADAQRIRNEGERQMHQRAEPLAASNVHSQIFFIRPLAVEPKPVESLTPNYEPTVDFETDQQQRFRFQLDLFNAFGFVKAFVSNTVQTAECSVSLKSKEGSWDIRILAAKAPSS